MFRFWEALVVFTFAYTLIITERIPRTIAALGGAVISIALGIISQQEAFLSIDMNVILLLVGMMVISEITGRSGLFQWMALVTVKLVRGKPVLILAALSFLTALLSAVLANVTVVVVMVPLTLFVCEHLRISPYPYLISEIIASNIGGAATLVGDPPNLLIGSAAGLDFLSFLVNLGPITLAVFVIALLTTYLLFRKDLRGNPSGWASVSSMDPANMIQDRLLFRQSLVVMVLVLAGFCLQSVFHIESATVALGGASLLLLLSGVNPYDVFKELEWDTIFFFIGLFILVKALVKVGAIELLASKVLSVTGGSLGITAIAIIWLSGLVSGIIYNIPYTAAMIPLVRELGRVMPVEPLWWSLALGACLGGNATIIGAAANVMVASIAGRAGYPITFRRFLFYGLLITVESLVLSSLYVWLRYL